MPNVSQHHSHTRPCSLHALRSVFPRLAITLAACVLIMLVSADAGRAAPADETAYQSGLRAVKAGDHRKAVSMFSRAIEINPRDHRYYNDRGIAYRASGDLDKALKDYGKALEIKPDYPNALNNRGLVYVQQGLFDKAIADFNEALKHGGFQAKVHTNLGLANAGKGNHQEAVRHFEEATSFRPVDPRAFFFMAQSFEELGQIEKALKMYQVALGVIKDPGTEELIETKLTQLEKTLSPAEQVVQKPPTVSGGAADAVKPPSKPAQDPVRPPSKPAQTVANLVAAAGGSMPEKRAMARREIMRAGQVPHAVINLEKKVPGPEASRPATLEELNRAERSRALAKFSPNAAEIFRQGLQFMDQADTRKALIRFEDTLQLERRNRNLTAGAWSLLEIGRVYLKIGDHTKAWANFEGALRAFRNLRAGEEVVITLVEMSGVKKASGQSDHATKLLSEAARDAATLGNQRLASALEDMAAGREPRIPAPKPSQAADPKQPQPGPAASHETQPHTPQTKQMPSSPAIPALGSKLATASPQILVKPKEGPVATAAAKIPAQPERTGQRTATWGMQSRIEPAQAQPPASIGRGPIAETNPPRANRPPVLEAKPQPEKAALVAPALRQEKPVSVETLVGGEPAPVQRVPRVVAPTVQPARPPQQRQAVTEPDRKVESKVVALQEKPALREKPASPLRSTLDETAVRPSKAEFSQKRINEDLAELKKFKQSGDETSMIVALERLAKRYALRKEYDKALHSLVASLALREKLGVNGASAKMYLDRGVLKEKIGDRSGALEDMTRALTLVQDQGPTHGAPEIAARCKSLAEQLGLESSVALEAFRTLWRARLAGDGQAETDALYALGRLYDRAYRPSEALNYYERSSASVLTDKARMYEKMGKHKLAEQSFKEALETFKKLDYSRYLALVKQSGVDITAPRRPRR